LVVRQVLLFLTEGALLTPMSTVLYYHPYSRAANVVWMMEELEVPYERRFVDITKGEQKQPAITALNPMGKLPIVQDGEAVVTEAAAIGLYLADKYAPGRLAPDSSDPLRATYLRWAFFAPSVIEPGCVAKSSGWTGRDGAVGWGNYDAMLSTIEHALSGGDFLLGDKFSMADVVFGGTLRFMLRFKMIDQRPSFAAYAERLSQRPALQRADLINAQEAASHGLSH
jgi:glutathione S-transferase